ncbi:MAG: ABC transporter permease [Marinilabiliaceae bacterium]|nr:ABC transporter permease [Marinilabiliaceae bacterium]
MNVFKLSWRNLWRNKRRTLITVASVFFGVILSSLMTSMQEGSYNSMIDTVVKFYSGYAQIHQSEYWENKTINNSFEVNQSFLDSVLSHAEITQVIPRLESFVLASGDKISRGAMIIGIDPVLEDPLTHVSKKVVEGSYLKQNDDGIMVGINLASKLELHVGDTLVLLGQGFHGISAAGKYPIKALFKHASPELNRSLIYIPINICRDFLSAPNRLTSIVLMMEDNSQMRNVLPKLRNELSEQYSVMSWEEMFPTMIQQIESDRSSGWVMKLILYVVIGFGIFGTILMMMNERKHEFGVMVACGMPKIRLATVLLIETIFIGAMGLVFGLIGSLPVVGYFYQHPYMLTGPTADWMLELGFEPYMFFSLQSSVFTDQIMVVVVITGIIAAIPFYKSLRFKELNALKD